MSDADGGDSDSEDTAELLAKIRQANYEPPGDKVDFQKADLEAERVGEIFTIQVRLCAPQGDHEQVIVLGGFEKSTRIPVRVLRKLIASRLALNPLAVELVRDDQILLNDQLVARGELMYIYLEAYQSSVQRQTWQSWFCVMLLVSMGLAFGIYGLTLSTYTIDFHPNLAPMTDIITTVSDIQFKVGDIRARLVAVDKFDVNSYCLKKTEYTSAHIFTKLLGGNFQTGAAPLFADATNIVRNRMNLLREELAIVYQKVEESLHRVYHYKAGGVVGLAFLLGPILCFLLGLFACVSTYYGVDQNRQVIGFAMIQVMFFSCVELLALGSVLLFIAQFVPNTLPVLTVQPGYLWMVGSNIWCLIGAIVVYVDSLAETIPKKRHITPSEHMPKPY